MHAADPAVEETIKRTVQSYFVLNGNICALLAAKDHVNVFLYDGGIVPDPEQIITAGHNNNSPDRRLPRAIEYGPPLLVAAAAWLPVVMIGLRCGGAGQLRQPAVRDFP